MTVALLIASQFVLSAVPGVEVVTVLLAAFSAAWGVSRGVTVAACFSLMRCLLFGFVPQVVILYLVYYPLFAAALGLVGKLRGKKRAAVAVAVGTLLTPTFTLIDDVVTPLVLGLRGVRWKLYAYYSLPVMGVQTLCAFLTLLTLFLPLETVFRGAAVRLGVRKVREKEEKTL